MTEKRFTITQDFEEHHRQIRDNGHIIMGCFVEPQAEVIVDLLNELAEKNNELQFQCNLLREQANEFHRGARENANKVGKLEKENKELKKELLIHRRIASCSNCKYQNYDWFDDGDEFEICERGNNEQQIEYHICKDWREI